MTNWLADLSSIQQNMYSKNILALNRATPSKAKIRTQIITNVNLATLANHKSNYTASFYARKPETFTASIYARNTLDYYNK